MIMLDKDKDDKKQFASPIGSGAGDLLADSTDASVAGGLQSAEAEDLKRSGFCKPQRYDWAEVAHLFEDGIVPEELSNITDPIEYNYILVRLKRDFNENHRSDYMKYMNL
jgi:hypothetical protein